MSEEFRAAGEFYGHLLTAMIFGDLTMQRFGQVFVYQWHCKIRNKPFYAEHRITDLELRRSRFLGDRAVAVTTKWKQTITDSLILPTPEGSHSDD